MAVGALGTQYEHKLAYATSTQARVRNINTSARTQHQHKLAYATSTQAHVRNINTSARAYKRVCDFSALLKYLN